MGKQNNETDEWVTFALIFTRHFTVRCSLRIILLTGIFLTAFNLINYFDEKLFHEFSMQRRSIRSSFSFLINENFIERKKTLISIFSISYSTLYFCSNSMCTITRKKKKKKERELFWFNGLLNSWKRARKENGRSGNVRSISYVFSDNSIENDKKGKPAYR